MRYLTAGESHGKGLTAIIDGLPSGIPVHLSEVNRYMAMRQTGYGRGDRMKIETDSVEIMSGVRGGVTTGGPVTLWIQNKDYENWENYTNPLEIRAGREVTKPRPGHADLYGALKYGHSDIRNVLERASARETASRVAIGAFCMQFLHGLGISTFSHVLSLGGIDSEISYDTPGFSEQVSASPVRCGDPAAAEQMVSAIKQAKQTGDSLGGVVQVVIQNVCPGIGSYTQWDEKLDAKLAFALMSIQSVKGVSFGKGFEAAALPGSGVHDEIFYDSSCGFTKQTNRAGGIEGGMSNGMDLVIQAALKPIPTLYQPLRTADLLTGEPLTAAVERSDTCAVPAGSVVAECAAAAALTEVLCSQFGTGSFEDFVSRYQQFAERMKGILK